MKIFLLKILIVVVPLTLLLAGMEGVSRMNDNSSICIQKKYVLENRNEIEGLFFGPSHIKRGIYPKYFNYNVASLSILGSSVNVDFQVYEFAKKITKPKFLIFDLSKGYLFKTNNPDWIKAHKLPFYFPNMRTWDLENLFLMEKPLYKHLKVEKQKSNFDKWGFEVKVSDKKEKYKQLDYQDSLIRIGSQLKKK